MFEWILKCFDSNYSKTKQSSNIKRINIEERKRLRNIICKVCNINNALYYHIYENGPTHCCFCKEDGMRIYIHKN